MSTNNFKFAQLQPYSLSGAGAVTGATSVTLKSMTDIDGNALTMAGTFGAKGFGTLEPGNGTLEEQISFTGLVNNTNGTVTLTGVSNVTFTNPYTETSGLLKTHAGSTSFVISNTSGFYNSLLAKDDDAVITGQYQFPNNANTPTLGASYVAPTTQTQVASKGYVDSVAIQGAPNASTSVQGLVQLATQAQVDAKTSAGSTGAKLVATPDLARSTLLSDYVVDTGTANTYVITPSPAITAYTTGQVFSFKSTHANTTASTLNVNTLGAKTIKKNGSFDLAAGDIVSGGIYSVEYDGTNLQLLSMLGKPKISQDGVEIYAASSAGTDTYAITLVPAIAAYTVGQVFRFSADVANTGAATLNVNAVGALNILRPNGSALVTGDIVANQLVEVEVFDASNCKMLSPYANTPSGLFASGTTTKNAADASATQNIAHGFGVAPKFVTIQAFVPVSSSIPSIFSQTAYNGATQSSLSTYSNGSGTYAVDTSFTLNTAVSGTQVGVVTFDATNIIITWTKTGSPTGSYILLWTAQS